MSAQDVLDHVEGYHELLELRRELYGNDATTLLDEKDPKAHRYVDLCNKYTIGSFWHKSNIEIWDVTRYQTLEPISRITSGITFSDYRKKGSDSDDPSRTWRYEPEKCCAIGGTTGCFAVFLHWEFPNQLVIAEGDDGQWRITKSIHMNILGECKVMFSVY